MLQFHINVIIKIYNFSITYNVLSFYYSTFNIKLLGILQIHKWENCMTIDRKSWGFRRNAVLSEYFTLPELIKELVTTVSCGGNLLMNVGPTKDGIISPIFEERLRGIGLFITSYKFLIFKESKLIFSFYS